MIKVRDGYGKLIGSDYNGNIAHVLLSNGGNLQYAVGSTASTLVLRNASGQIESSVASTVAPFVISSTKVNANLNADLLDGFLATGLFQSLTSAADKNLYIKIGNTEKEVSLLYASYLGGVTKEGLFTELTNVNDTTNPNSIKVTIGDTTKYLKVAYSDLAGKVVCSASTSDQDRPIVVTNTSNGVYYSTKVTLNYSTGNVTAPTFTGTLIGNADTASKLQNKVKIWGLDFDGSSDVAGDLLLGSSKILGKDSASIVNAGDNHLVLGYGYSEKGWSTYVDGNSTYFRYGTTHLVGMFLDSSGKVGIGTISPSCKLDVNGEIHAALNIVTNQRVKILDGQALEWNDTVANGSTSNLLLPRKNLNYRLDYYDGTNWHLLAYKNDIPTKTSQLTNDSGYVTGGPYLPLSGGTVTGNVVLKAALYGESYISWKDPETTKGGYFYGTAFNASKNYTWTKSLLDWNVDTGVIDFKQTPTVNGNSVWHSGNDGSGSGLDADLLDGYHASYENNRPWGTIPVIHNLGWIDIGRQIAFHYDNTTGSNYSTLLQTSGNNSNIVTLPSTSGTLALTSLLPNVTDYYWANINITSSPDSTKIPTLGGLDVNGNIKVSGSLYINSLELAYSSSALAVYTPSGKSWFGMMNTSFCHIYTDAPAFYFNKPTMYANGNLIWHEGNDGSGSGLDADLLDGKHASSFQLAGNYLIDHGMSTSRPNGGTFTLPAGTNGVSMRSKATSGNDIGIFLLTDDNAFICNSSDNNYLFATFDTDKTADFSTASNAAFAVLSDHAGVSIKGLVTMDGYFNIRNHYFFVRDNANADWVVTDKSWKHEYAVIHAGNIGSQSVNYATSAGNADTVDGQHFNWNNNKNDHTYLWAASSNGQAYLVHRASMSVNYASSAGNADTVDSCHKDDFLRRTDTLGFLGKFVLEDIPKGVTQVGSIGWTDYQSYPYAGGLWMTLRGTSSLRTALILFPTYSMSEAPILYSSIDGGAWLGGYLLAYKKDITNYYWANVKVSSTSSTTTSPTFANVTLSGKLTFTTAAETASISFLNGELIDGYGNILLGTNSASWNVFSSSRSSLITVLKSGNVGIGDSNPAYKLEVAGSICGTVIYANRDGSTSAGGVSLYSNSDPMTYGIAFRGTGTYGTHGYVTAANDWATYLTMSDTTNRGWIFRRGATNVASIAGSGNMAIAQNLEFSNGAHIATNRSTDYHYGYTFNLTANEQSIGMYSGPIGEAGGVVISPDGCLIYNSSDCGYNLQVRDKDLGADLTNAATLTFGIEQTGYYAWSRGGFKKNGSDDSYVLLGGGGHKAESSLSVNYANSAGSSGSSGSLYTGSIGSGGDSHASALRNYFNSYKTAIPRNSTISLYSSAYSNGSQYMGYFLSGYNDTPYGGFFVAHYDACYYVGISSGNYNQQAIITSNNIGSQSVSYATSAGSVAWGNITGKPSTFTPSTHYHNYFPENTAVYFRDPNNASWRGGMYWGSAGNEALCFVAVNANTSFRFFTGSDIANWTSSTWQGTPAFEVNKNGAYAPHFYESSDIALKDNVKSIINSDNIPQLKSFDWKSDGSHSYGLIALELEEMGYPELVSNNGSYKTVNYSAALSLIVGKLQVKIKELEKEIENLKNKN